MTDRSDTLSFTRKPAPGWLLRFWKEIDDKTFGAGFDCLAVDATCHLGVARWQGRETIRANLRAFIDTGFTALHEVEEYWDGGAIKMFRGVVAMTPDAPGGTTVHPVMTHLFHMDPDDHELVRAWYGAVGPTAF